MAARDQHGKTAPWQRDGQKGDGFQVVGSAQRKIDGIAKATGQAVYTDDIQLQLAGDWVFAGYDRELIGLKP